MGRDSRGLHCSEDLDYIFNRNKLTGELQTVILILMKLHQDSSAATCFRIWSQHAARAGSLQSWLELRRDLVFRIWLEASSRVEGHQKNGCVSPTLVSFSLDEAKMFEGLIYASIACQTIR